VAPAALVPVVGCGIQGDLLGQSAAGERLPGPFVSLARVQSSSIDPRHTLDKFEQACR